ncbi:MAG: hypothetical protein ACOZAO_03375 [Patescibacteria group bacterium]
MPEKKFVRKPEGKNEVKGKVIKASGRHFTVEVPGEKKPLIWANAFYDSHKGCWWGMVNDSTVCWWEGNYNVDLKPAVHVPNIPGRGILGG